MNLCVLIDCRIEQRIIVVWEVIFWWQLEDPTACSKMNRLVF